MRWGQVFGLPEVGPLAQLLLVLLSRWMPEVPNWLCDSKGSWFYAEPRGCTGKAAWVGRKWGSKPYLLFRCINLTNAFPVSVCFTRTSWEQSLLVMQSCLIMKIKPQISQTYLSWINNNNNRKEDFRERQNQLSAGRNGLVATPGLCIKSYLISQTMHQVLISSSSCPRDVLTPALSKEKGICDLNQVLLLLTSLQLE